jgi:CRISPR/Cas system-associated endoribonuclease Cas2
MYTFATSSISVIDLVNQSKDIAQVNLGYLSISVTIIALLGGAFYLFNIKPLKDTLDKQEKGLKSEIENFKAAYTKEISSLIDQKNQTLISDIQTKIAVFDKDFTQKFNTFATEKDNGLKTVLLAEFGNQLRTFDKTLSEKISSTQTDVSSIKRDITSISDDLIDLLIEYHLNKNQIGAFRGHLDKLKIATQKGWGVDTALFKIKEYITEHNMPSVYQADLTKSLKDVSDDFKVLKDEISKLAVEKNYKVK